MITGLDHIGIAVSNLNEALEVFEKTLGMKHVKTKVVEEQKVKVAVVFAGETKIELLEPTSLEAGIAKFLAKRGEGIHHLAFKVDNIEKALEEVKRKDIALIDEKPRIGFEGHKIAFLHPKSTRSVLVEFCQK